MNRLVTVWSFKFRRIVFIFPTTTPQLPVNINTVF